MQHVYFPDIYLDVWNTELYWKVESVSFPLSLSLPLSLPSFPLSVTHEGLGEEKMKGEAEDKS